MNKIQNALSTIKPDCEFFHFGLDLTGLESRLLKNIQCHNFGTYSNYGAIEDIPKDARSFFEQIGNDPISADEQARIVQKLVKQVMQGFDAGSAWVDIRAFLPTPIYDLSRWHPDGKYYADDANDPKNQYKVLFTFKGAGTLLTRASPDLRAKLMQIHATETDEIQKRIKCAALIDPSTIETTPPGHGTIIIAGSKHAAFHSEPPIKESRIFVSVVPGTKVSIEDIRTFRGQPKTKIDVTTEERTRTTGSPTQSYAFKAYAP